VQIPVLVCALDRRAFDRTQLCLLQLMAIFSGELGSARSPRDPPRPAYLEKIPGD